MLRPLHALILVAAIAASARAAELPRLGGMYQQHNQPLPMVESKIDVTVRGPLVEVIVTQRFHNRSDHATEATYIFPLPPDAAVSAMWIKTGTKTIRAKIARRDEAQQRYEDAVRAGVTTALLDQERPDIFTQTVAGIAPRSFVEVSIRYDALAHFYDGAWGLAVPMVVAPRYVAGVATSRPTTGTGRAPDTNRAPDASRVTPGGAPGAGGPTTVNLTFVDKVWDITSPTHELDVKGTKVSFVDPKSDHDAIIRWRAPNVSGWVEPAADGGFAAVVVEAPAAPLQRKSALRCMLVLDRSAAARGDADALAQPLVRQLLANLDANDRVAVHGSDAIAWNAPPQIQRALDQSWSQKTGPFDLTKVLSQARPDGAPIVLVSGALVADDRAAIAAAKKLGVPVHVIGVGPAPARGLLASIATATGGTARFANPGDDLPALARAVIVDVAHPAAPLTVTWGTLQASDVVPGTLPRLGTGQAVLVLARVKAARTANARAGGELFSIEMLPAAKSVEGATGNTGPLGRRWARSRLEEMIASRADATAITRLALAYGLVSPYTSMVAIGEDVVVQGGTRRSVAVPVSVPAGMKWQQVKQETAVTGAVREPGTDKPKEPAPKPEPQRDGRTAKPPVAPGTAKPPVAPGTTTPPTIDRGEAEEDARDRPKTKKKKERVVTDDEAGDDDAEDQREAPARDMVGHAGALSTEEIALAAPSSLLGRDLRLTTSFAGGFTRALGENAGTAVLGGRIEIGRRFLVGADASVHVVDRDAQGRVLLSFARRAIARYLEVGGGAGVHFGAGLGPAGSLSLRYHLPPLPRAAVFLRYDGALLVEEDTRRGQNTFTLGVEYGF